MLDKGALIFWEAFDPDKEEKSITSFLWSPVRSKPLPRLECGSLSTSARNSSWNLPYCWWLAWAVWIGYRLPYPCLNTVADVCLAWASSATSCLSLFYKN
jgi:hypothetical protein